MRLSKLFYIMAIAFLVFWGFFYGLSAYPILDMNEGLYAEIAREMVTTGNYLIPHLNQSPYLEKPPLLYWLIAGSYHIFGVSTFAARIIPAFASFSVCLLLMVIARKINQIRSGYLAAVIFASSLVINIIGRTVFFDMLLTAFLSTSLCFFFLGFTEETYKRKNNIYITLAYITLALAFLTKGILPLGLSALTICCYLLITQAPKEKWYLLLSPRGISLFLLITLPWIITASFKHQGFLWDHFINEQFLRFLNQRIPHDYHTGPWYYYFLRIVIYLLPWSLFIPLLFKNPFTKSSRNNLTLFLWSWLLLPLAVFTISGDKGDYYMIVSTPALAWLIALQIDRLIENNKTIYLKTILAITFFALIAIGSVLFFTLDKTIHPLLFVLSGGLFIIAIYLISIWKELKPKTILSFLSVFLLTQIPIYLHIEKSDLQYHSQFDIAEYIKKNHPDRKIFIYQTYEQLSSIVFFLEHLMPIVDSRSLDLEPGRNAREAAHQFLSVQDFLNIARDTKIDIILLQTRQDTFKQAIAPANFCVIFQNQKAVLFSNDCLPSK